jgi:hypothetical protein
MTGRARLVIDDLTIVANRLASLDAEISVEPIDDPLNWIERDLVSHVVQQTLGFALPEFLPERFEYTQLGVRLMVRDEVLYVLGTHGPREQTILTVRVGAQDLGVVREPAEPYNLGPWFDTLRAQAFTFVRRRLDDVSPQKAWRALSEHVPPASLESSAEEP